MMRKVGENLTMFVTNNVAGYCDKRYPITSYRVANLWLAAADTVVLMVIDADAPSARCSHYLMSSDNIIHLPNGAREQSLRQRIR